MTSSRRDFLKGIGAIGVVGVTGSVLIADDPPPILKRLAIQDFSADAAKLDSLRRAVKKMRGLPPRHPFSWVFQANIHWRPFFPSYVYQQSAEGDDPVNQVFRDEEGFSPETPVFNSCPHGNWWFLPWHRAYLYFFERILRWAAGDPALTIPYWNYCDPNQREMPEAFRSPAIPGMKGVPNPLYLPSTATFRDPTGQPQIFPVRDDALNRGLSQLTARIANKDALRVVPFTNASPSPAPEAFGSPRACDPTCQCGSGALERLPHNQVHNAIGGAPVQVGDAARGGFMGDISTAARDPIFWLHHAQIDRLWASWVSLGAGRRNPEDPAWLNAEFTFYDVDLATQTPVPATLTPQDLLDTQKLGYQYDQLEAIPEGAPSRAPVFLSGQSFKSLAETPPPKAQTLPKQNAPHAMNDKTIRLSTTLPKEAALGGVEQHAPKGLPAFLNDPSQAKEAARLVLSLEGIELKGPPGVDFEVYLGLPKEAVPTADSPYFVGTMSFLGAFHASDAKHGGQAHSGHRRFDERLPVPEELAKLLREGKVDTAALAVKIVPRSGTEAVKKGVELLAAKEVEGIATVRQIRLLSIK